MFNIHSNQGSANQKQPQNSIQHQLEWLRSKAQITLDAAKNVEKEEQSPISGGNLSWKTTLENRLVFSQKTGNSSTSGPSYTTPVHIPESCSTI